MTFKLGLTGSIGMGKSTTANIFADAGCTVWDADEAVHRLYGKGGAAVAPISATLPDVIENDAVSRDRLGRIIADQPDILAEIEAIVHPLVAADRDRFLSQTKAEIAVLDIPLLFETGGDAAMDAVVCVSAPAEVQKARVLARPGMTEAQFRAILAKQMPDAEKRKRADYVIITDTEAHARRQVAGVIADIKRKFLNA